MINKIVEFVLGSRNGNKLLWVLAILLVAGAIAIGGWLIMALWNYVMPDLFGLKTISFKQALALFFLGRLLFGSSNSSSSKK